MSNDNYYSSGRYDRNSRARDTATRAGCTWTGPELALLASWDRSEETLGAVAARLQRTPEGCRQQYYITFGDYARERQRDIPVRDARRSVTTPSPTYNNWPEEDRCEWFK